MRTRVKVLVAAGAAVVVAAAAASVSVALSGGDDSLTGTDLERATTAALEHTSGIRVVEGEVGDGSAAYEVAVLLDDGSVVEVQLDHSFQVTGSDVDAERSGSGEPGETSDEGGADDGS